MTASVAKVFVIAAAVLGGLLAGVAVDRSLVQLPAWQQLGPVAWANFTRVADLGRGMLLYPAQGLGALLCSVVAAIVVALNWTSLRAAAVPVSTAAVLAIAALIVTRYWVAPEMLSLRRAGVDVNTLQQTLSTVKTWWSIKAALHLLTFLANVWALVAVAGKP